MKTRVVAVYAANLGADIYHVERYADFDTIDAKLGKLCWTSNGLYWRSVVRMRDKGEALTMAENLAKREDAPGERIVAEFGEEEG